MVSVELKDIATIHRDLETFARKALPYGVRNALNRSAFEGRKAWVGELQRSFVLRNTFTTRQLRVVKATGTDVRSMAAFLGSLAPFMRTQEFGGTVKGKGGSAEPIPTSVAAGQAMGSRPRTKQVRRPNWLSNIRLKDGRNRGKSRKQRNAIAVAQAARKGSKFAFVELEERRGIVRVTGRKRIRVRMLWDLSRRAVRVPATPTLQRTLNAIAPKLPTIHRDALVEQLKRNRVLGYR